MTVLFDPRRRRPFLELLFVILISCLVALVFFAVLGKLGASL